MYIVTHSSYTLTTNHYGPLTADMQY